MPSGKPGPGANPLHEQHTPDKVLLCCVPIMWLSERLQQLTGRYMYLGLDTSAACAITQAAWKCLLLSYYQVLLSRTVAA